MAGDLITEEVKEIVDDTSGGGAASEQWAYKVQIMPS